MSRLMSVAFTEQAVRDRTKTVTRRKGWWEDKRGRRIIYPGDTLTLCRKVMGRKPGEPLERIAEVLVVDVRREPLSAIRYEGWKGTAREGFPNLPWYEFCRRYFTEAQRIWPDDEVTRIEWAYLDRCFCAENNPGDDPEGCYCDCSEWGRGWCIHA